MGKRGPLPKVDGTRQRRNSPPVLALAPVPPSEPPPPTPRGFSKSTRAAWATFWTTPVATLVDRDSDMPALGRLFAMYDERDRCWRSFRRRRFVEGYKGQPVLNPLAQLLKSLDSEIRALEDRFGLTPAARLRLGISFGEAKRSLEDLNRDVDHDTDDLDPRLAAMEHSGGDQKRGAASE